MRRKLKKELKVEVADLSETLVNERKLKKDLKVEVADLSENLVNERKLKKELKVEVASLYDNLMNGLVPFKGKKVKLKDAVNQTADTVTQRAVISSKRNVSSMAGEALPWVGTAVIVGVTALEVNDLCMTIKDMNELKKAFNKDYKDDGSELSVCSMKIPGRSVIIDKIKSSPSATWETAKNITPSIEDLKNIEIPDINWEKFWKSSKSGFSDTWSSTKGVSKEFWGKTKNWWNK